MKKGFLLFCILVCIWGLTGCSSSEDENANMVPVYYISKSETKVEKHEYNLQATETEEQLRELLNALGTMPLKSDYKAPMSYGFQIIGYALEDGKLLLNMDEKYKELSVVQELLVRSAIVRTLTQLPEINFVAFRVNDEQLFDNLGNLVGWMASDEFIENAGSEINAYEEVRIKLYFANEAGDGLVATNRTVEYNSNISLEKLVVEELIKGPNAEGVYPTINPATKVANVTVRDNICYVNLDENFLAQIYNVTPEVAIYSLVNSLGELTSSNKVQILVNGDTDITYREKYELTTYFERNLDLITTIE